MKQEDEKPRRVVITSPSLDESENVSGISTLVRQISKYGNCDFVHFSAGRKDGETDGAVWLVKQILLPIRFIRCLIKVGPAIVHINTSLMPRSIYRDAALTVCARLFRRPLVVHFHGGRFLAEEFTAYLPARLVKRMIASASRVLVLSAFEKATVERRWPGSTVEVLPNAVAAGEAELRTRSGRPGSMLFLGRIDEMKGLDEIVAACRELRGEGFDFEFNCYGTGPQQESFVNSMRRALGGSFHYGGIVRGADKWRAFAAADVFLLPSRFEGLPMALLEAMASECAVVATRLPSIAEVVKHGFNGLLVEPGDSADLAAKLRSMLVGDVNCRSLGENARKTVFEWFSIEDYVQRLRRIYGEIGR